MRLLMTLLSRLNGRYWPLLLALLASLLCIPSLFIGFNLDDYLHRAMFTEVPGFEGLKSTPLNPFSFYDGSRSHATWMMIRGLGAWWTNPTLKVVFWRPLAAFSHALDYALWPDTPALMHAHNLFWFAALVWTAGLLYRRWLGATPVAVLAGLLYAVDDAHGFAVGWIANRNALMATTFGFQALLHWDRARKDGERSGYLWTPLCLGLALLSGEFGMATAAWLAAYTLVLESDGGWSRLKRLGPSIMVTLAWLVCYLLQGSGTRGSASYINPLHDPGRFLVAVLERVPILLQGLLAVPPADAVFLLPPGRAWVLSLLGLGAIVLSVIAFRPLLQQQPIARFFALGSAISILPICATLPMDRLLFFVGFGVMGLLSLFITETPFQGTVRRPLDYDTQATSALSGLRSALPWVFIVLHLCLAPLLLPMRSANPGRWTERLQELSDSIVVSPAQTVQLTCILNAPDGSMAGYIPLLKTLAGQRVPDLLYALAVGTQSLRLRTLSTTVLELEPEGGYLQDTGSRLVRDPRDDAGLFEPIRLPGMTVEVVRKTDDGRPQVAHFEFDTPLVGNDHRWLVWQGHRLVDISLPPIGTDRHIPAEKLLF